jgi:PAS domain S-box-containing protein
LRDENLSGEWAAWPDAVRLSLARRYAEPDARTLSALNDTARLAARLIGCDAALISLTGEDGARVIARHGAADLAESAPQASASSASATLLTADSVPIGVLSVLFRTPRALSETIPEDLALLARQAVAILKRGQSAHAARSDEGVLAIDCALRVVFCSAQAAALIGHAGDPDWIATDAAERRFALALSTALAKAAPSRFETPVTRTGRWLAFDAEPAPDGGLILHVRDETAERPARERLALLESAIAQTNDIILITEAEPIDAPHPLIVFGNRAYERKTGFAPRDYIGQSPRILQGPLTQRAELDRIRAALKAWSPVRVELINYTKAGEPFWLELDIAPVADASGWYTHWVAVQRDITERKIEEEKQRAILDVAADVVFDYDPIARTIAFSEGMRRVFGHDWAGVNTLPSPWIEVVHPDDLARARRAFAAGMNGETDGWTVEYRMRRADGDYADVIERTRVLRGEDGAVRRVIGALIDATQLRALERQLQDTRRMDALGHLVGGLAHDFNNLLTVILGNSELVRDRVVDDQAAVAMADEIAAAATRGASLTRSLLAFAKRQTLRPEPTSVADVLDALRSILTRTLSAQITLAMDAPDESVAVLADAAQLESAILNLVINARDAIADRGVIRVSAREVAATLDGLAAELDMAPGRYIEVAVSDDGAGMDAATLARATEPFFTTKSAGKGSGLGLSMVHGFARQSGGGLAIDSAPRAGTAVRLYLPQVAAVALAHAPEAPAERFGAGETILIVEDDEAVRTNAVRMLTAAGYRPIAVDSAESALAMLGRNLHIDALFSDVVMAGPMTGFDLAAAARLEKPDLPILLTTGYSEAQLPEALRKDARLALIGKPYGRRDVVAAIGGLLG